MFSPSRRTAILDIFLIFLFVFLPGNVRAASYFNGMAGQDTYISTNGDPDTIYAKDGEVDTIVADPIDLIIADPNDLITGGKAIVLRPYLLPRSQKKVILRNCTSYGRSRKSLRTHYCGLGAFSTAFASKGMVAGKWYFEATLTLPRTGIQIGTFTTVGIHNGDDISQTDFSPLRGFQGNDILHPFITPEKIKNGDVFGVSIDLDSGTVEYTHNGLFLGKEGIQRNGKSIGFFAATSVTPRGPNLRIADMWTLNFGSKPFAFSPSAGFEPYDSKR